MAFTLATSLTEVRSILNESVASFWSDTEIENWIKQGCLDWCEKSLLYIEHDTITLATGTYKYTTSGSSYIDNAIFTLHCEHNNRALQRVSFEQLRGHNERVLATDPVPNYFYDQYNGTTFNFYMGPTPVAAYDAQTLTVLFAMRTDDITKIPYEYQPHIFLFAIAKAKSKERQWQETSLVWQQYINNINFARRDSLEQAQMTLDKFRIQ